MTMEKHLRRALVNHELSLCYQPQLELTTGRVIGVEALLRWQNPELGAIPPGTFIPLAEDTGLIIPIGDWVLRTACRQNSRWQKAGLPPLTMAVNLSPRQFWNPGLIGSVTQILQETGLDPACLELEIIESMVMRDINSAVSMLKELKSIGVKLSIDDFGTGYSSLNHLRSFPFDKLKMDISFVREVTSDPGSAAIAKTIISLAHNLNLLVIAEGVETKAQLSYLRNQGCDEMQGFFFSKPIPAEDLAQLLLEDRHLSLPEDNGPHVKTMLLVDDEQSIIEGLKRTLHSDSYRIISATSADEGFNQLALNQVDVILCDQRMPGMSGIEFLNRVKDLYPGTVRIAMSGYADAGMVADAINRSGIHKFLIKPISSELLRETLEEAFMVSM
jgi:EAL domain-containing protein (putative c-di-GMP-specific phosphodiesterase class I)/CheY-like chemotaxis protein